MAINEITVLISSNEGEGNIKNKEVGKRGRGRVGRIQNEGINGDSECDDCPQVGNPR
jgi:hypothetical protein